MPGAFQGSMRACLGAQSRRQSVVLQHAAPEALWVERPRRPPHKAGHAVLLCLGGVRRPCQLSMPAGCLGRSLQLEPETIIKPSGGM